MFPITFIKISLISGLLNACTYVGSAISTYGIGYFAEHIGWNSTVLLWVLLGIFAVGAPGVPGGTVMASLGLITGVLMLGDDGAALMLAIFALQDSFGTACNVTGDGALTLFLTGYAEKHGIEEAEIQAPVL